MQPEAISFVINLYVTQEKKPTQISQITVNFFKKHLLSDASQVPSQNMLVLQKENSCLFYLI